MSKLVCEIVTPERLLFSEEVFSVSVPAAKGDLGILVRRAPIMSTLNRGVVRVRKEEHGEVTSFAVAGGYIETDGKKVVVLADRAEAIGKLSLEAVHEARADNEKKLASVGEDDSRSAFYRDEIAWYKLLESQLTRN